MFLDENAAEDLMDKILDRLTQYRGAVRDLTERGVVGYIIQTESASHYTVKIEDLENRVFSLEHTVYPDVIGEELMYMVTEGFFLDENYEPLKVVPMRWQDYYIERTNKIQETLKELAKYIREKNP